jgi:putative tryptophan/tyrosine transport system substrate-binding protein
MIAASSPLGCSRRKLLAGLAAAPALTCATWSLVALAQPGALPVVGFLHLGSPETTKPVIAAFRRGLAESGFVEGRNVVVEYRLANGHPDRVPALAAELVNRHVAVLASGYQTARAAKDATATIPIVFMGGADPVKSGLVASINRPGGNVTGVSLLSANLVAKRIGLLHELVPRATVVGLINDRDVKVESELVFQEVTEALRRLGLSAQVVYVSSEPDFDDAFATFVREGAGAIIVTPSTLFNDKANRLVALAARHSVPTVYELREFVEAGGLMSYGPSLTEAFRQGGVYSGHILKGEAPADLPVLLPTKFELVINAKTAKALGLTIPETLLATADEVIQ